MAIFLRNFTIYFSIKFERNGTSAKLDFLQKGESHSSKMTSYIEQANVFLSSIASINHSFMEKDVKDTLIISFPKTPLI